MAEEPTFHDEQIKKLKNKKIVAYILIFVAVLGGIAGVITNSQTIYNFFFPPKTQLIIHDSFIGNPVNDKNREVYTEEIIFKLLLIHNRKAQDSIIINHIETQLKYAAGENNDYVSEDKGELTKAFTNAKVFDMELNGDAIKSHWRDNITIKGKDLLATDNPISIILINENGKEAQDIRGVIVGKKQGLYEISFKINYTVASKQETFTTKSAKFYVKKQS